MVIVRAPVRISFGGGGTDLAVYYEPFGGFVVSTAIARYCYVVARPTHDRSIHIRSADYQVAEHWDHDQAMTVEQPLILPRAAIRYFQDQAWLQGGVDLFLAAEVPPGTGLGSSSAMTVALVRALAAVSGMSCDAAQCAEIACEIEIARLGMPIGKQDHYASAFGGINTIRFSREGVIVEPLRIEQETVLALDQRVLLFAIGHARDSATILEEQRHNTLAKPRVTESLHRIKELAVAICGSLESGDLDSFGRLLDQSWREKRSLSGRISSDTIDESYAEARAAGALGGKITGAGGGGFLLLYCPLAARDAVRARMRQLGGQELPWTFDSMGVQTMETARDSIDAPPHVQTMSQLFRS